MKHPALLCLVLTTASISLANREPNDLRTQSEWSQVVGSTSSISGGFGNADNIEIRHLQTHEGVLFAATVNEQTGAEVWRSQDGVEWNLVHSGGIGSVNATIQDFVSFDGSLYAASNTETNCIWRSENGTSWKPLNEGPCTNPASGNDRVWKFVVFGDHLYAGTTNAIEGCEIWRSDDGDEWQPVVTGGFGTLRMNITELEVFDGRIYAATLGEIYPTTSGSACQLWRSPDGVAWTQVLDGCLSSYFRIDVLEVFQGTLYAGTGFQGLAGFNLWFSNDGVHWTEGATEPSHLLKATENQLFSSTLMSPYQVLVSSDGSAWTPDNDARFGNPDNYRNSGIGVSRSFLYVAARNDVEGSELWRKFLGLFAGGFETGDTTRWSATIP